jgi:apolipoprotein N-acyltransferase
MKLSILFVINAIVSLIFGLVAVFAPGQLAAIYGGTVNDAVLALYRINGASLIGFAAVAWFIRNAPASEARRGILFGFIVGYVVYTLVFLFVALQGIGTAMIWVNVVISLAFALAYAYFAFMAPSPEPVARKRASRR